MSKSGLRALFIDRDGVINKDPGGWTEHSYVTDAKDLHFLPGALEALKILYKNRVKVVVVSNQAGVAKGYFTRQMLDKVNAKLLDEVAKKGGHVEEAFYCMHKNEDNCRCRKPKTGLFAMAADKYNIDMHGAYVIGDSKVDIEAGKSLGLRTILVLSGKSTEDEMKKWVNKPDLVFKDLLEAVRWLMEKEKRKYARAMRRKMDDPSTRPDSDNSLAQGHGERAKAFDRLRPSPEWNRRTKRVEP